jgi:hypothetical protein
VKELEQEGHNVVAVSRNTWKARDILGKKAQIIEWDGIAAADLARHLTGIDAIINLAGENIASGRWTGKRKKLIRESRINTGKLVSEAIRISRLKPSVLIQGSAIGFYGTRIDTPVEEQQPAGSGFIAELTEDWEASVTAAGKFIPRIVVIRTGLVLGQDGGLLEKMLLPFSFNSGTVVGSGKQWISWIHIRDEVRAIRFLLENNDCSGPYNLTSTGPVRMEGFIAEIAQITGKKVRFKVPGLFLRAALGKMAKETVLASQNIYPGKLMKEGFKFDYPELGPALKSLLNHKKS